MQNLFAVGVIVLGYIMGSIPFGLLIVRVKTGKDIRDVESGRTGGTNAMRAAGFGAGLLTAILDVLKGATAVWIAQAILPNNELVHVVAAISVIIGHNYSMFLPEKDENGNFIRLRGGAGGASTVGGAMGLWIPSIFIIFTMGALTIFTIGIASIATISVALFALILFSVRAYLGYGPWMDVLYGIASLILLVWALRPNIQKLMAGNERVIKYSLYGLIKARREKTQTK
jgi:acyl phosphate:glycerol-3-phosphate acyltransferase